MEGAGYYFPHPIYEIRTFVNLSSFRLNKQTINLCQDEIFRRDRVFEMTTLLRDGNLLTNDLVWSDNMLHHLKRSAAVDDLSVSLSRETNLVSFKTKSVDQVTQLLPK